MINKKLIHFNFMEVFQRQKLSADKDNKTYTVGSNGEVQNGDPDIKYQSIVFIRDKAQFWTHGKIYGSIEEATQTQAGLMSAEDKKNLDTLVMLMTWE